MFLTQQHSIPRQAALESTTKAKAKRRTRIWTLETKKFAMAMKAVAATPRRIEGYGDSKITIYKRDPSLKL